MESIIEKKSVVVFRCPNCQNAVRSDSGVCQSCGFDTGKEESELKAEIQSQVNEAYNNANNLRFLGLACLGVSVPRSIDDFIFGYFTNSYVEYFPLALLIIFFFFFIRWQYNFGGLKIDDSDFAEAKKFRNLGLLFWTLSAILLMLIVPLIENLIISVI